MKNLPIGRDRRALRSTGLAVMLAAAVLLPLLGHKHLTDWDEGIYAEVSREMLTGSWLVPHWNGQLWLEKPPLMLWITAGFFRIIGISEFAARLGSALSGLVLVSVLHLWLERRRDRLTAWSSTLILLSTFGFLHICRVGEMDALLSLGCMISLIGLAEMNRACRSGWYLFWGGAAVAVMTKGAASVVIFLTAALFAIAQRWRPSRINIHFWAALGFFLAAVLPWHVVMYHRFGQQFLAEYFGLHVLARATEQIEGHRTRWWYYLKVILVSAPPFALLYPWASIRALRVGSLRAFAIFGIVIVVLYSAVQTRLPHYIAPAYPAFTVVTAAFLADSLQRWRTRARSSGFWLKAGTGAAVTYGIAAILTAHARSSLHSDVLSDGRVLPDNKEAAALLSRSAPSTGSIPGPLLVLRPVETPVNTDVFYSRRHTEQVELIVPPPHVLRERYTYNSVPLEDAVTDKPSLMLIDRALEPSLPPQFTFRVLEKGDNLDLGTIRRNNPPGAAIQAR